MIKFLFRLLGIFSVLIVLVIGGGLYVLRQNADAYLPSLTQKAIPHLVSQASQRGVVIANPTFESVAWDDWLQLTWRGLATQVELPKKGAYSTEKVLEIEIGECHLGVSNVFPTNLFVELNQLKVVRRVVDVKGSSAAQSKKSMIKSNHLKIPFQVDLTDISSVQGQLEELFEDVYALVTDGVTKIPVEFEGNSLFGINFKPVVARMWIEDFGGMYKLVMGKEDLRKISDALDEELSEPEVALLSEHPLRAPRLLRIRNDARSWAEDEKKKDGGFPEDAYRHVMWSYMLTKAYGPDFAKRVTDAHEVGDPDDDQADHQMDYHNNEIGRRYALKGYDQKSILSRVKKDPEVIRFAQVLRG